MNLQTKKRFCLLNSQQNEDGCSVSNFVAKKYNFYWFVLNKDGFRISLGMAKNYSESSIEFIPIDHEKMEIGSFEAPEALV